MQRKPQAKSQATILVRELKALGLNLQHQRALDVIAKVSGFKDWNTMKNAATEETSAASTPAPEAPATSYSSNPLGHFNPDRQIAIIWSVDDVQSIRPDLSTKEALEVLRKAKRRHDASLGINWDVLGDIADWDYSVRRFTGKIRYLPKQRKRIAEQDCTFELSENGRIYFRSPDNLDCSGITVKELQFDGLPGQWHTVEQNYLLPGDGFGITRIMDEMEAAGTLPVSSKSYNY